VTYAASLAWLSPVNAPEIATESLRHRSSTLLTNSSQQQNTDTNTRRQHQQPNSHLPSKPSYKSWMLSSRPPEGQRTRRQIQLPSRPKTSTTTPSACNICPVPSTSPTQSTHLLPQSTSFALPASARTSKETPTGPHGGVRPYWYSPLHPYPSPLCRLATKT
jgi:hypothetical protein